MKEHITEVETSSGGTISSRMLRKYFRHLVDSFYKILPMWEEGQTNLGAYMKSFQAELLGCKNLIVMLEDNPRFISLASALQFLIDHPESDISVVRREVFKAIQTCYYFRESLFDGDEEGATE